VSLIEAPSSADLKEFARNLAPRTRVLRSGEPAPSGRYVLYWCTTALRAEENPALERALLAAHKLEQPLLVYHGLSSRYAHANDRLTGFALEGEPSLREAITARGARYVFALDRGGPSHRWLDRAAAGASVVVTDDFPTYDVRAWVERFVERATVPVLAVDAACVVPMQAVGRAYTRAFAFRDAVASRWADAMRPLDALGPPRRWQEHDLPEVPDVRVHPDEIDALLASLPIDHAIPRSSALQGGAPAALSRWREFSAHAIKEYDARRNDALDDDGVSRMSAYLHWGMVWAGRLAREASSLEGDGPRKWLDELLVWRELAWAFCFHEPRHGTVEGGVPPWAREGLAGRTRVMLAPSALAMELGETGDSLWDAAQRRLRRDGLLHNNVRMTWGKQLVAWHDDPVRALEVLVSLNHRYALDGRDPASFGGLLWCLGQFDRPHPRSERWGTVRSRETRVHARRLDPVRYGAGRVGPSPGPASVTILGAGLAGIACARTLHEQGVRVTVLEKSGGVGGRIANRRVEGASFAHGAPVLHSVGPSWTRLCALLADEGLLVQDREGAWRPTAPATRVVRRFADSLGDRVRTGARATRIERGPVAWIVGLEDGTRIESSHVVLAMPAPQAAELAQGVADPAALSRLRAVRYEGARVAMGIFEGLADGDVAGHRSSERGDPWIARWSCERAGDGFALLVQGTEAFVQAQEGADEATWSAALLARGAALAGLRGARAISGKAWRYARAVGDERAAEGTSAHLALCADGTLLAAGDGIAHVLHGRDGEAAWASGTSAASALLAPRR
jgi:photolyase PhrII